MKRLLTVLLVVFLFIGITSGCGSDKQLTESAQADQRLINQTVTDYVNSVYAFDFENATNMLVKDTELYDSVYQMQSTYSIDVMVDAMFAQLSVPDEYKQKITNFMKEWISKTMADSKLEIINTTVDNDYAVVNAQMSTPDLTSVNEILQNYDKYITEEQLGLVLEKYSLSDDKNAQWNLIIDMLPIVFENASKDIEYIEYESELELRKIDGKWLILSDKS